ncbi:hypothetical protein C8F01DRAFT_1137972 [Mycena amicta]|nr:hypothetical protein C8F01DRAFT_1137972 [Mycena amicta]
MPPPTRERIPPEIWSEVFGEVDKKALQALRLSNQAFAQLARPHLFSSFIFHPHACGSDVPGPRLLPSAEKAEQYLNRLEFWLSDDIAPLVRSCTMRPWMFDELYYGPFAESDHSDMLMEAIAEGLGRFPRLRIISCFQLSLGDAIFATLTRMSSLRELRIIACDAVISRPLFLPVTGGPMISTISLRGSMTHPMPDLITPWMPFLDPRYLRAINLDANLDSWSERPDAVPVFTAVTELRLTITEFPQNLSSILHKFPAVEYFEFGQWEPDDLTDSVTHGLAVGCQPFIGSLKTLSVTHHLLPILLPQASSLTELIVESMDYGARDKLTTAFACPPIPTLVSLRIDLNDLDLRTLLSMLKPFPGLQQLFVEVYRSITADDGMGPEPPNLTISQLFSEIVTTSALPAGITEFSFTYRLYYHQILKPPPHPVDVVSLRDAFLARYQALASLLLDAGDFLINWERDQEGYIVEYAADDAGMFSSRACVRVLHPSTENAEVWRESRYSVLNSD